MLVILKEKVLLLQKWVQERQIQTPVDLNKKQCGRKLTLFFIVFLICFFLIYFDMNSLTKKTINPVINNKSEFIFIPL